MTKKDKIIKLIDDSNEEYWDTFPDTEVETTEEENEVIHQLTSKLADDIIGILDEEE